MIDSEDDFHSDICESVNLHASGQNPMKKDAANSMGCQTVYVLDYYETIDNSYKKGIFYPITKQCETSKCHIHKSEDQQND